MRRFLLFVLMLALLAPFLALFASGAVLPTDEKIKTVETELFEKIGNDTVGAGVLILENGVLTMLDGAGYADMETGKVITAETVFEIGELSGVFVALAAYCCKTEGTLDTKADISRYLSPKEMKALSLRYPVSVRQLLLGTAGFAGREFDVTVRRPSLLFSSLEEAVFADVPQQVLKPDTAASYSAFGVALAALVIERASGMPYDTYVRERVLAPLGMSATYLFDNGETSIERAAVGYEKKQAGGFAENAEKGRTYAGLYPACGALCSLADLSVLLSLLAGETVGESAVLRAASAEMLDTVFDNGVFRVRMPAFRSFGDRCVIKTSTASFTLSLVFDRAAQSGALVVTNTAESSLSDLPLTLFPVNESAAELPAGDLLEVKKLEGAYRLLSEDNHTFAGRFTHKSTAIEVKAGEDGTLLFGERALIQIARGVFADREKESVPVLQFLTDDEGTVRAVVTFEGAALTPAPFYARPLVQNVLFYLLLFFALWFFFGGFIFFFRWKFRRTPTFGDGFLYILPDLGSSLIALLTLIQILAVISWGFGAFLSLFRVLSVLSLVVAIGVMAGYLLTLAATLTDKKIFHRSVRNALFFVIFALLLYFWGLTPM